MTDLDEVQQRRITRATVASRALLIAAVCLAVVIIALQLVATLQTNQVAHSIAQQQSDSVQRARDIKHLAQDIESCTSPEGACYKRGQKQTGAVVGSINEVVILAAACAKEPDVETAVQIQRCIRANLDTLPPAGH